MYKLSYKLYFYHVVIGWRTEKVDEAYFNSKQFQDIKVSVESEEL